LLAVVRQTVKQDINGQWSEIGPSMRLYVVRDGSLLEITGSQKGATIRALLEATVRKSADADSPLTATIKNAEKQVIQDLWKPSEEELRVGIRHSVMPLLAAVISD
jgi:hypothetical protein